MLRIRFLRVGKKNSPSFRLVLTPRRTAAKTGRFLEILGSFNPVKHESVFKKERIQYWISQGAQASDTVRNMLIKQGIIKGKKVAVHKKETKETTETKETKEIKEIKETQEAAKEEKPKESQTGDQA